LLKTRYKFFKRLYNDCVIVFNIKEHFYIFYNDVFILNSFKTGKLIDYLEKYHINYVIMENVKIIRECKFKDNRYKELLQKSIIIYVLRKYLQIILS